MSDILDKVVYYFVRHELSISLSLIFYLKIINTPVQLDRGVFRINSSPDTEYSCPAPTHHS